MFSSTISEVFRPTESVKMKAAPKMSYKIVSSATKTAQLKPLKYTPISIEKRLNTRQPSRDTLPPLSKDEKRPGQALK